MAKIKANDDHNDETLYTTDYRNHKNKETKIFVEKK